MKIKRKWIGLLFGAILCLPLFPITAFAANQGELWINGKNIVQEQDNIVACGDGTAFYTSSNSTLTLTNAVITQANLTSRAIDIPKDTELKIVLNGENTIDGTSNGFFAGKNSNITFSGDGSLTIKSNNAAPFVSNSNITIDGATLTVFNENDGAIQVDETLTIQNGAYIEANGLYYGVQAGSLSITTGSELTATSSEDMCNPIWVYVGDLSISDSTVSGKGYYPIMAKGNITIANSTVVAESSADFGIYSQNDLLIKGNSDVTARGVAAIGAKNSFKLEPPEGGLIDVFVGSDEKSALKIDNSPLTQKTDLSAYGNDNIQYFRSAPHTHLYDQENVSEEYLAAAADCENGAKYYYSCVCGKKGTETFTYGVAADHSWSEWYDNGNGTRTRICSLCKKTETEKWSSPSVPVATEQPPLSASEIWKNTVRMDIKTVLNASGKSLKVTWGKVPGADGYDLYVAFCNKKLGSITKSVGDTVKSATIKKLAGKKLRPQKSYKVKVKAYRIVNGRKEYIANGTTLHAVLTGNRTYTNARSIQVNKKRYTLKKGKKATVRAVIVKQKQNRRLLPEGHGSELSYISSNSAVASVSKKGRIVAKKKGRCTIYVRALNGVCKKIKVVVK